MVKLLQWSNNCQSSNTDDVNPSEGHPIHYFKKWRGGGFEKQQEMCFDEVLVVETNEVFDAFDRSTHGKGVCRSMLESDSFASSASPVPHMASSSPFALNPVVLLPALLANIVLPILGLNFGTGGAFDSFLLLPLSFLSRVKLDARERDDDERFRGRGVADIIWDISGDAERVHDSGFSAVGNTWVEYIEVLLGLRGVWAYGGECYRVVDMRGVVWGRDERCANLAGYAGSEYVWDIALWGKTTSFLHRVWRGLALRERHQGQAGEEKREVTRGVGTAAEPGDTAEPVESIDNKGLADDRGDPLRRLAGVPGDGGIWLGGAGESFKQERLLGWRRAAVGWRLGLLVGGGVWDSTVGVGMRDDEWLENAVRLSVSRGSRGGRRHYCRRGRHRLVPPTKREAKNEPANQNETGK
ncbi:hypothetical protein BU15DRAFT_60411 [Melanogaster broomeanus]|nr:hypothetical protein BU15DRAFT_60411 [Melanogaster broomeanus]